MFSCHNNATVIKNLFPCCFVLIQVQSKFLELELPGQRVSADGEFCCSSQVSLLGVGLCPLGHHLSLESVWDLSPQRCCRMPVTSGPHSPACPSPAAAMPSFQVTDSCPPPAPVSPSSSWGGRRSSLDPEGRPVSMWKHRGWNRMFCLKNSLKFAAVNVTGVCNLVIHKDPLWTNCEGHRMPFAQSKLKWVSALWDQCSQSRGLSELLLVHCYLSEFDFSRDFVFLRTKHIHILFVLTYFCSEPIQVNQYLLKTLSVFSWIVLLQ